MSLDPWTLHALALVPLLVFLLQLLQLVYSPLLLSACALFCVADHEPSVHRSLSRKVVWMVAFLVCLRLSRVSQIR